MLTTIKQLLIDIQLQQRVILNYIQDTYPTTKDILIFHLRYSRKYLISTDIN